MAQLAQPQKILLMGRAGAGKTSMKSIIFANYLARDTNRLHQTNFIEHSSLRFMGNLRLNLWDCGGQDVFMENYFESQRETIFQNAEVLIYVLVAANDKRGTAGGEQAKDMQYFQHAMDSLRQFSPSARVFVLIHKLDLVHEQARKQVLEEFERQISAATENISHVCFGTSIWDETLFKAWSTIVETLIPHVNLLKDHLDHICQVVEADEVVLFERNTFLLITSSQRKSFQDSHRFEKISNIVKQFKLSAGKAHTNFKSFEVRDSSFNAIIEPFLQHSFIMVVVSDTTIEPAATSANLFSARNFFRRLQAEGVPFGAHM
eukprot:TRINITY_DN23922_c0_g1_i1.p1 TRINITY_DN23922_c0_g1~~TRINITY_DN23922_c0_g1_i1.p1  ORF type:complete len:319 (-),score=97.86 TRINITY_DN23922_c0_g1_i1:159-1115(-)